MACTTALGLCLLSSGCDAWFYRPDRKVYETAEFYGLEAEDVELSAPEGPRLHGWWVPARGPSRGTVVYCHGNHANLTWHARFVSWLPARGFNLLLFDYRGYGRSAGAPDRAGVIDDTVAAIDFALQRDPGRTVVFGHSLGGAAGIVAAARRARVRGVAVESTFSSYRAAATCTAPLLGFLVPLLISSGLDPVDALPEIPPRPLLVIHGTDDEITPLELGRELFDRALEPKTLVVVEGGKHISPWVTEREAFEERLCAFFLESIARAR